MSFIADLREAMLPFDTSFDKEVSFIADLREAMLPFDTSFDKEEVNFFIQESLHEIQTRKEYNINVGDCSKDDSDDNLQELSVNDDMDLDDVRSEDGKYLDLSADNDHLAIVEALISDMVNKVVNACIYASSDPDVVVKLRDMIDEVCLSAG